MIDTLAQTLFTQADANHNHVLNRDEFQSADAALSETLEQWGRQGLIGKPKKPTKHDKSQAEKSQPDDTSASSTKIAKSNKVSEAEFAFYVQGAVEQADQGWRNYNAMTAAQRKAYNAQRAYNRARRRGMYPNSYPGY
ncbi:MAG TPA: hypothetical protein VHV08_08915 [Pirellulales bacterium]|nr:hypothetical protein [Pirellulales bacterium]